MPPDPVPATERLVPGCLLRGGDVAAERVGVGEVPLGRRRVEVSGQREDAWPSEVARPLHPELLRLGGGERDLSPRLGTDPQG